MILGIGVDIVRTARFADMLSKHPQRIKRLQQRILHPMEVVLTPNKHSVGEIVRQLASSWAAKEAMYKTLSQSDQQKCIFNQWRRVYGEKGQELKCDWPRNDEIIVSLSHDGEYTIAYALRQLKS